MKIWTFLHVVIEAIEVDEDLLCRGPTLYLLMPPLLGASKKCLPIFSALLYCMVDFYIPFALNSLLKIMWGVLHLFCQLP